MAGFNPTLRVHKQLEQLFKEGKVTSLQDGEDVEGIKMIPGVPAARIAEQRDKCVIRPDDVFIATYPKCGTTWTQQIVKLIANNGVETGIDSDEFIPWHEHMSLEEMESMPSPRFFKSHLPYQLMPGGGDPANTKAKYISVIRNPKDAAVSGFNHVKKMAMHLQIDIAWDTQFNEFLNGSLSYGPFYSHFLGWWAHRDAPNILMLTFEQMKRNPRTAVTSIASFLGYSLTDEVIDKIVIDTSFDKMKDNKAANKSSIDPTFMRKGIIGDWRNVFPPEHSAMIDALVEEKFAGSGLVFDYGDV